MGRALAGLGCAILFALAGCGGTPAMDDTGPRPPGIDAGPGHDAGSGPFMDGGQVVGGPCAHTLDCSHPQVCYMGHCVTPGPQDGGVGMDGGCVPGFEICGDHISQACNGHDESCGDNDHDNWQACRPPAASIDWTMCDCDDTDPGTYPARGTIAGGAELCDGKDNDCDFIIDEAAACCTACMALPSVNQADSCGRDGAGGPTGACSCSTNAGGAPCPTGQSCCSTGCVDTTTSFANCGFCGATCTAGADTCAGGQCRCGAAGPCQFTLMCTAGACH